MLDRRQVEHRTRELRVYGPGHRPQVSFGAVANEVVADMEAYGLIGHLIKDVAKGRKPTFRPFGIGVGKRGRRYQWQDWLQKRLLKGRSAVQSGDVEKISKAEAKIFKALAKLEAAEGEPLPKSQRDVQIWKSFQQHRNLQRLAHELKGGALPEEAAAAAAAAAPPKPTAAVIAPPKPVVPAPPAPKPPAAPRALTPEEELEAMWAQMEHEEAPPTPEEELEAMWAEMEPDDTEETMGWLFG